MKLSNNEDLRNNKFILHSDSLTTHKDGWMREFNVTFAQVRPNRQAGTTVMRLKALVARI